MLNQTNVVAGTRAALIPDIQGSVIASLDSSSGTFSKIGYLPYGKSASATAPFGYTAQRIDPETNGLYYYRARHYSPTWGRFMQTDPVGTQGGVNLYAYVNNDPLNLIDPFGWSPDSPSYMAQGSSNGGAFNFVQNNPAAALGIAAAVVGGVACAVAEPCGAIFGGGSLAVAGGGTVFAGGTITTGSAIAVTGIVAGTSIAAADLVYNSTSGDPGPYSRPSNATTPEQRASVQGQPCVTCGNVTDRQVADHIDPLVEQYYRNGGNIDMSQARSVDAVQAQCPTCSARQGGYLRGFSQAMKNLFGY